MNFKTPFKVLTTAALIGTLSLSAVAPGVASAATKTTSVVKAKETANLNIASVVLAKKADPSDKVLISYQLAGELLGNNSAMNGYEIVAIITEDGTVFDYQLFGEYAGNGTPVETLKQMADAGATTSISGDVKVGELADGKLATTDTPAELPGEEATFEVTEIAAITENGVTVNFPKLTADKEGVTVEVKDSKNNVVAVEALDLSAGEETAEFAFKTPVKSEDLTGTWTVDGKQIDLSLVNNLKAFEDADTQTATYKALQDLGVENLKSDNAKAYNKAKADFLSDLAKEDKELTKEAIQAFVDQVNTDSLTAEEAATIVKAVVDASGNNIKLADVLSNAAFKNVNATWVEDIKTPAAVDGYATEIAAAIEAEDLDAKSPITAVQDIINNVNEAVLVKEIAALNLDANTTSVATTASVKVEDLNKVKALIETYAPVDEDGEYAISTNKEAITKINTQLAVADVLAATTASKFKAAVTTLATLVDNKATLDITKYEDANGKKYIDKIAAINKDDNVTVNLEGVTGKVNVADEIGKVIAKVNTEAKDEAATKLVSGIKEAADKLVASATSTNQSKFINALKAAGITEVSTDKANKDAYIAYESDEKETPKTLNDIIEAATLDEEATAADAKTALETIQAKIDAANIAVVAAADKDSIVAALAVIGIKNVVTENAEDYAEELTDEQNTKTLIQQKVDKVNKDVAIDAAVAEINKAKDATAVKAALDKLADNGVLASYLKVTSSDRPFIAEKVLAARDNVVAVEEQKDAETGKVTQEAQPAKQFADESAVNEAVVAATKARTTAIEEVNKIKVDTEIDAVAEALLLVGHEALTGTAATVDEEGTEVPPVVTVNDTAIAERFQGNLTFTDEGAIKTKFKSIADIRNAIAAAK